MRNRYQEQWEKLGSHDPYWAVLTDPSKRNGQWDKEKFFESGQQEIDEVLDKLRRIGMEPKLGAALDFGCGVGRLSRALAGYFEHVIGIDISSSMLDEARLRHRDFLNIEFLHNTANNLRLIPDATIDLIYSNIVLQHMPGWVQVLFIEEFCRVAKPGGMVVFQTPSNYDLGVFTGWVHFLLGNRILNVARRIKYGGNGIMEIHSLAKQDILALLHNCGMSVKEIERYDSAGNGVVSYRYYSEKAIK